MLTPGRYELNMQRGANSGELKEMEEGGGLWRFTRGPGVWRPGSYTSYRGQRWRAYSIRFLRGRRSAPSRCGLPTHTDTNAHS